MSRFAAVLHTAAPPGIAMLHVQSASMISSSDASCGIVSMTDRAACLLDNVIAGLTDEGSFDVPRPIGQMPHQIAAPMHDEQNRHVVAIDAIDHAVLTHDELTK